MIRRTIWLTAGAVLGIAGYRRLDRAAKSLTGRSGVKPSVAVLPAVPAAAQPKAPLSVVGVTIGAMVWLARRVRASAGFLGEVRAGMDEYLDASRPNMNRQYPRPRNTLVGQRRALGAAGRASSRADDHDTTKDGR